jgi:hypothetical protein
MDLSALGGIILGTGGAVTGGLSIFAVRANKNKTVSETGMNEASGKEIEQKAIALSEQTYQARETFWSKQVETVRTDCEKEIAELREEIGWLRVLIENHVPWDWERIREAKLAGLDPPNPPTLNYIRSRQVEQRRKEHEHE